MARIGSLFVNLALEDAAFIDGLKRATRNTEEAMGKVSAAANFAAGAMKGFAASITVGTFTSAFQGATRLAAAITDAATQANIGVERYQTLREGLRALALTTEQTDQVLNRLSETLGAVQSGTAGAGVVTALDKMGVTARILNGEIDTTDELLDAIAASAGNFGTEAQFTAAVVDILGRKVGIDFAAAVRDGGTALREAEAAMMDFGAVIDRETIRRLDAADEAIERTSEFLRNKLVLGLGEAIAKFEDLGRAIAAFQGAEGGFFTRYQAFATELAGVQQDRMLANRFSLPESFNRPRGGAIAATPARAAAPVVRAEPIAKAATATNELTAAMRVAEARATSFQEVAKRLTDEGLAPLVTSASGVDSAGLIAAVSKATDSWYRPFEQAANFSRTLSDNLGQAIVNGQGVGRAMVQSLKAIGAEAVSSRIFDLLGGLLGGLSGRGGFLGKIAGAFGDFFGGERAGGGGIMGGRAYLVGERGPEMIVPSGAGTVIPNGRMRGAAATTLKIEPSPLFIATVVEGAAQAGAQAASAQMASARRLRLPVSAGAR